jgi:hypothetical protein
MVNALTGEKSGANPIPILNTGDVNSREGKKDL